MLSLTRKTEYALVALTDLARKSPANISAREIGQRFHLPLPVLTNILNQLARAGLVKSTRGPKGGYRLARESDRISLADVIEAIEGNAKLTSCCPDGAGSYDPTCDFHPTCPVTRPIQNVHGMVQQVLSAVTLEQIAFNKVPSYLSAAGIATSEVSSSIGESQGHPARLGDLQPAEPSSTSIE